MEKAAGGVHHKTPGTAGKQANRRRVEPVLHSPTGTRNQDDRNE